MHYEFKRSHERISKLYISVPEVDLISANSVDSDRTISCGLTPLYLFVGFTSRLVKAVSTCT